MEADGIFVYGSLRPGGARHRWVLRTDPAGLIGAHAPGRLFHLPEAGFPALVPQPEPETQPPGPGWVAGEFVGYEDEEALLAAIQDLDQVEDVDGDLYERRLLPVVLDSGHRYHAWTYVFPEDRLPRLEREAVELEGGDWSRFLH